MAIVTTVDLLKTEFFPFKKPGHVAQLVARLTQELEVPVQYPVLPHTFISPSADSRRAVVIYWWKYVHKVLVNRLGGLSLPRKSVVRLTDRPDMTSAVYCGRKTTITTNQIPRWIWIYEIVSAEKNPSYSTILLDWFRIFGSFYIERRKSNL